MEIDLKLNLCTITGTMLASNLQILKVKEIGNIWTAVVLSHCS